MNQADFRQYLASRTGAVEAALRELVRVPAPDRLRRAMEYSLFGQGKRLRPVMVLAACEAAGGTEGPALPPACAVELVHTYSLIHDDLPALDDDTYRRGRYSSHVVFGEAVALLAGDALLTLAFDVLVRGAADPRYATPADRLVACVTELAQAAGPAGMVGGQVVDLELSGRLPPDRDVEAGDAPAGRTPVQKPGADLVLDMYLRKTGSLFRCAARLGAIVAGAAAETVDALGSFGDHLGLAFQILDDLADLERDHGRGALSLPLVMDPPAARALAERHLALAVEATAPLGEAALRLRQLVAHLGPDG